MLCDRCGKNIFDDSSLEMNIHVDLQIKAEINAKGRYSNISHTRHLCRQCSLQCLYWWMDGREKTNEYEN